MFCCRITHPYYRVLIRSWTVRQCEAERTASTSGPSQKPEPILLLSINNIGGVEWTENPCQPRHGQCEMIVRETAGWERSGTRGGPRLHSGPLLSSRCRAGTRATIGPWTRRASAWPRKYRSLSVHIFVRSIYKLRLEILCLSWALWMVIITILATFSFLLQNCKVRLKQLHTYLFGST